MQPLCLVHGRGVKAQRPVVGVFVQYCAGLVLAWCFSAWPRGQLVVLRNFLRRNLGLSPGLLHQNSFVLCSGGMVLLTGIALIPCRIQE